MAKGFQAVKFVLLDFDEDWKRVAMAMDYTYIRYTAPKEGGRLAVVNEGATGILSTYHYQLEAGEEVFVVDQVVHIPSRCMKQDDGNIVRCG